MTKIRVWWIALVGTRLCILCWRPARRLGKNLLCRKHYRSEFSGR